MQEGDLFRNVRKALGLSQEEFGKLFNRGQSWVTKLERGNSDSAKEFLAILRILVENGINPYYLVRGEGEILLSTKDYSPVSRSPALSTEERLDRIEVIISNLQASLRAQPPLPGSQDPPSS